MDPIHLIDNEAITPNLLDRIVRKLSDKSAVRLALTCRDGLALSSAKRGKVLEIFETVGKNYRQLVETNPFLRSLSFEQARSLGIELGKEFCKRTAASPGGLVRAVDLDILNQQKVVLNAVAFLLYYKFEDLVA